MITIEYLDKSIETAETPEEATTKMRRPDLGVGPLNLINGRPDYTYPSNSTVSFYISECSECVKHHGRELVATVTASERDIKQLINTVKTLPIY